MSLLLHTKCLCSVTLTHVKAVIGVDCPLALGISVPRTNITIPVVQMSKCVGRLTTLPHLVCMSSSTVYFSVHKRVVGLSQSGN